MIFPTLRNTGLAVITAASLLGCDQASVTGSEQTSDGGGGSRDDATIAAANVDPQAAPLCVAAQSSALGYNGSVLAQITDDNSQFQFNIIRAPQHGSLQLDLSTGDFNYLPTTAARGYKDSFDYSVDDLNGGVAEGTVELVYGTLRIMPLGDSITYGVTGYTTATGDSPTPDFATGYRKTLYDALLADGYQVDFVGEQSAGSASGLADPNHQGMPGWTSWAIGDELNNWLTTNPTDVVLAHVGTNDHNTSADGVNHVLNNINNWSAGNNKVKTFVATIVDQRPDTFFVDTVEAFNSSLAALVDASWPEVTLVDQYSALDNQLDLTPLVEDSVGLHPNVAGYEKMAAVWLDALQSSGSLNKCP